MSTPIDTGGPAYPLINRDYQDAYGGHPGMTLRDHFAGLAVGYLATELYSQARDTGVGYDNVFKTAAAGAYELADAMIAEREKGGAK